MSNIEQWIASVPRVLPFRPELWNGQAAEKDFPFLSSDFEDTRYFRLYRTGVRYSYEAWYNDVITCLPYALGDQSIFIQRALGSSNLDVLAGNFNQDSPITKIMDWLADVGLHATGDEIRIEGDARVSALFVRRGKDYHFLRLDEIAAETPYRAWTDRFPPYAPRILNTSMSHGIEIIRDPRLISLTSRSELVYNPGRVVIEDLYNFVSFVNIPHDLSIPVQRIIARKEQIIREYKDASIRFSGTNNIINVPREWSDHIDRMNLPKSGAVLIPQVA